MIPEVKAGEGGQAGPTKMKEGIQSRRDNPLPRPIIQKPMTHPRWQECGLVFNSSPQTSVYLAILRNEIFCLNMQE